MEETIHAVTFKHENPQINLRIIYAAHTSGGPREWSWALAFSTTPERWAEPNYSSWNWQGEGVHTTPSVPLTKLLADFCLLLPLPEHLVTAPKLSQWCRSLKVAPGKQAVSHRGGRPAAICSSPGVWPRSDSSSERKHVLVFRRRMFTFRGHLETCR